MKTVSVSDAKSGLSALIRELRSGEAVVITDRGVPVAQLVPPPITAGVSAHAIELAQRGRLILPSAPLEGEIETILQSPLPQARASAVAALRAERDDGY